MKSNIKIGTRGSALALWQANWVKSAIEKRFPSVSAKLEIIKTKGDRFLKAPLAEIGGKGLFVKEIEQALMDQRIDIAVHSMKDMPGDIPPGLVIGAVPEREDPRDALVSRDGLGFQDLPAGARVGTGSLRRAAQLLHRRPDIEIAPLRGNLNTRLEKLEKENLDAIVLAVAGIRRLGLEDRITQRLDADAMLPAVGQGALCLEIRENDPETDALTRPLNHDASRAAVEGERAFLKRLGGDCHVPVAAHGRMEGGVLTLTGLVADVSGKKIARHLETGRPESAGEIGVCLAEALISRGADEILKDFRE
ncbi:Porphobilinogen deaminase [Candidatus Desulfarcum epimagneticum]|uniref:Porphobilinogen deaminase n=1 Tax=uncultured Desulfobacteraceae bacterium TaxID=218296 RepID=A0A484HHB6_9BACT|nr:Porphobilinogen deaminase [uncultured Desulfobacteraceae bacterium]